MKYFAKVDGDPVVTSMTITSDESDTCGFFVYYQAGADTFDTCYGDFMGVDYKILMSFTCEASTIDSIISRNNMRLAGDRDDDRLLFEIPVSWWNVDLLEKAHPYKVGKENEYWKYRWYDSTTQQALYEEFSL